MLPTFSFLSTLCAFFLLLITYLLYAYILRPYTIIQYYKKQGGIALFHRKLLRHQENVKNAIEKDDYFFIEREAFRKQPQARFLAENFMSKVMLIIHDLEMTKEYLRKFEVYQKDREVLGMIYNVVPEFTLFQEGNAWKKKRRIISSAFNFEFIKHIVPMIAEATQEKFTEWKKSGELKDMRLLDKLGMITGEVTGRFFFGKKFGQSSINGQPVTVVLQEVFARSQKEIPSLGCLLFGPKFIKLNLLKRHRKLNQLKADLREYCEKMIEESEKSTQKENNLLQVLLDLRKSDNEEDRLTNKQVVDEFIGLFAAGTDTTSHLVNSAIYFLWKNPHVMEKVKEEIDREFTDLETLTIEKLNRMEYTTAFLKESLRLGGPAQSVTLRVAVKDDDLCGVHVKKGTRVVFRKNLYFTSEKFFPKPKEIIPERWLLAEGFNQSALKEEPYAFIPFLAGPRNCVGQHLAIIEAKIIIGLFVRSFRFSFPEDYQFRMTQKFVFEPVYPLLVTLEPKF